MSKRDRSLSGAVIAITGGARGIGKATAVALARAGARVAIGDLDGQEAAAVAAKLGAGALGVELDVTDHAAFTAFLDEVEHVLGPLDVLINNAGIFAVGPIEQESDATTGRVIAINLHAMIHGTREAVRRMKPRRRGHIVNVSSVAGRVAGAYGGTYTATKHGILGFSEAIALELKGSGVEISAVLPSICRTEMVSGMKELRGLPWIQPEDVADAILATLRRPRFEVPVPRAAGITLKLNQLLPFGVRSRLAAVMKTDSMVSEADDDARRAYRQRLRDQGIYEAADTIEQAPAWSPSHVNG